MDIHLILYNSNHGQTKKICHAIAAQMENKNLICEVRNIKEIDSHFKLSRYQSVLFGMPVYYGKHNKKMIAFIKSGLMELKTVTTGVFSVNLTARKKK